MDEVMPRKSKNNPEDLFDSILSNWPIALAIASMIFAWAHFQSDIQSIQDKQTADESQATVLSANYNLVSQSISGINAKLDILIKHDNL